MLESPVAEHRGKGFENVSSTTLSDVACNCAREPSVARSAGFANVFACAILGFRFALPQALRCHPLRGL